MPFLLVFFLIISLNNSFAQSFKDVPIGEWRVHPSNKIFSTVTLAGSKIYAGSENAFISFDTQNSELKILSKIDGFSDQGISKIAHNSNLNITVIGYSNGNIDLIKENQIVNIDDIKRKQITGTKNINHISFHGNYAYLSTNFGLVTIDLKKEEVRDAAVSIGSLGRTIEIFSSCIKNDSIYIATSEGLKTTSVKSNLLDFSNWYTFKRTSGLPEKSIKSVINYKENIYALVSASVNRNQTLNYDSSGLYLLQSKNWAKVDSIGINSNGLNISDKGILISCAGGILIYNPTNNTQEILFSGNALESIYDNNGKLWIADQQAGLRTDNFGKLDLYYMNGPTKDATFKLAYTGNKLFSLYGGYNTSTTSYYSTVGFDVFENNTWKNYSSDNKYFAGNMDFVDAIYNSWDNSYYVASYGSGLFQIRDEKIINMFGDWNSPLVNSIPGQFYIRACSIAMDSSGLMWVTNRISDKNLPLLHSKSIDGTWKSYVLKNTIGAILPYELVIDLKSNKWIRFKGESQTLVVFDENSTVKTRYFKEGKGVGGLPNGNVTSVVSDKNGDVWVGTTNGIAVLKSDSDPMKDDFTIPYFDGFPLLMDKIITSMVVDGGNRKWVGTKDGLWLFNDDASEVIAFYNADNSPLPVSEIQKLAINSNTGELFILTTSGLMSYRSNATDGREGVFSNVKVFPNPVKPDYSGIIGISGLANNANVKITDVFGNMVYETQAEGGTASWSGLNFKGERVNTGVYLVFSATADGQKGNVAKIAFVK